MEKVAQILHLEDDPADAELVVAVLDELELSYEVSRVDTRDTYEEALRRGDWDLLLADYRLPDYDGLKALRAAREECPDVPFLFVSGTIGEEAAIAGLREGATDYVLKTRLSRLGPAVHRALREADDRRQRRRAEEELRKLSRAVEQSGSSIVITDTEGYIEYANPRFAATTGYTIEEVIGQHTRILKSGHTPDAEYAELWRTVTAGKLWRGVFLNRKKSGELYWESVSISPIKDNNGEITHFLAVKEDISELKNAEEAREKLEAQLRHAQKLEALGTLAGGIAHDFNNIINVIQGYGELMQMRIAKDDRSQDDLAEILSAARRAAELSRSLLIFSRKQTADLRPTSLNDVVEKTRKQLLRLIGEDIEIRMSLSPGSLTIMGDTGQLTQVLVNFATNARDAMPQGGVLTLTTVALTPDDDFVQQHGFGAGGRYARISLSDTGTGMRPETTARVFEPFFTTKEVDRGTGLGLSIVYGIVKQHDGYVECESEPGVGTTFHVYLPLLRRDTPAEAEGMDSEPVPRGRETVLVAEDDRAARTVIRQALEAFGYTVIEALDGAEAVQQFRQSQERIDLVILDAVMPKKSGREAFEEMSAIRSGVTSLFITGYVGDPSWREWVEERHARVLQKPIGPRDLVRHVRELLDGGSR